MKDCAQLLFSEGLLYLSFVEGAPSLSGYQTGSNGDRIYFYYHQLAMIQDILKQNGFRQVALFTVNFPKQDGSTEAHTILIAQRLTR